MEKMSPITSRARPRAVRVGRRSKVASFGVTMLGFIALASFPDHLSGELLSSPYVYKFPQIFGPVQEYPIQQEPGSPYGTFPRPKDPFRFMPCTKQTELPALDDDDHEASWAERFDPDPDNWSWGNKSDPLAGESKDPFAGQGIYLCGYIDAPLDYHNSSDKRIVRLAVAKFQVSGLARLDNSSLPGAGIKSNRTLVVEPGGPGGSGIRMIWNAGQEISQKYTEGAYDTLGWDPRGVNASLPAISCYPYDADRDRWSMMSAQYREATADPDSQLRFMDALNNATFYSCFKRHGDLGRFMTTALVARDLEEIRKALDEDELTGYLVSYGTGIGQTYVSLYPHRSGRVILDGTEYIRDHRILGGFVGALLVLCASFSGLH